MERRESGVESLVGPGEAMAMDPIVRADVEHIIEKNRTALTALDGKKVLVTGGAGFLGAYFLDLFSGWNETGSRHPCEIYCLDSFISGTPKRIQNLEGKQYFRSVKQSITDPLPEWLEADYIIHCASIASPTFYRQHPIETMDANTLGTRRLLEYATRSKIKSMLFLSTSEIYGDPVPEWIPTPEEYRGNVSCTGPRACYDESKRFGETLCVNFFRTRGAPVKIARPFNVYGPGLRLDDKRVLPDFFSNGFAGKDIVLHSDGKATRSFCYVADAIDGLLKILLSKHDGEPFNLGNDREEISMETLAQEVRMQFDNRIGVRFEKSADKEYLTDNPQRRCPDLKKIRTLLGYEPEVMLREGLGRMKKWYEKNR